jgi:hypothetical protein
VVFGANRSRRPLSVLQKIYLAAAAAFGQENRPNAKEPAKICPSNRGIF